MTPNTAIDLGHYWCMWWDVAWLRHKLETFSALLAPCAENSPVNSPHKGQLHGALIFFFDLRLNKWLSIQSERHRAHYDVTVMAYLMASHYLSQEWFIIYTKNVYIPSKHIAQCESCHFFSKHIQISIPSWPYHVICLVRCFMKSAWINFKLKWADIDHFVQTQLIYCSLVPRHQCRPLSDVAKVTN